MEQTETEDEAPKVSVIIPVYNTEKYVQQALDSICRQTLHELEIIVVNDGSTDGSAPILRQAARQDKRIRLFEQENRGLSLTRNAGMGHATGKYVYFMDSDDLLEADALELCYRKCEDAQLDFVFFDAENFCEETMGKAPGLNYSHTKGMEDKVYKGSEAFGIQIGKYQFTPSACLNFIRRSFLQEHALEFYPHILHEDQLFTALLYLHARRAGLIKRRFFHRRIRPNSIMTSRFAWRNMESYLTVADELAAFGRKESGDIQKTVGKFLSQMLNAAVWQAHVLPLRQRARLFGLCLTRYRRYISPHTLAVLAVKRKKQS